jgi:KipI family sensor histidine kinase inhibitor
MRILPVGRSALLVEVDGLADVRALDAELIRRRADGRLPSVQEIVPGARTILLDGVADPSLVAGELAGWIRPAIPAPSGLLVEVPTVYDGADLAEVAALWGVSEDAVVAIHAEVAFEVAFCGFAPGFAYLAGLPPRCHVPRRPTPRPSVPRGSVALGGEYCGIYPRESPGGWRLASRRPPALLTPGARVRFVPMVP